MIRNKTSRNFTTLFIRITLSVALLTGSLGIVPGAASYADGSVVDQATVNSTAFDVWTLGSLARAHKMSAAGAKKTADLYAARGETISFQIVLKAPDDKSLNITDVKISNLSGPDGNVINRSNIDLYREHFIKVDNSSEPYDNKGTNVRLEDDWFPDALIPFIDPATGAAPSPDAQYKAIPYTAAAGENMPFWADINVPRNAVPGDYSGTYTLQTEAGDYTGQINLKVWNFDLPAISNLYTSFGIRGEGEANKPGEYNSSHDYKRDVNVHKELLRNRINPESGVNPEDEAELIAMGLRALNTDFWSGADYGTTEMDNPPDVDDIIAEANKHNEFLMKYNYTADEIEEVYDNPLYRESFRNTLKAWADKLHQAEVKQLVVSKPYSDLLDDADLGGEGKPIVDIFAILNTYYKDSKTVVQEARDKGAMVWTYPALIQDSYSPKWAIDYAPINYRINQGFINQSIGANGLLYWTVNYWTGSPWTNVNGSEDTPSEFVPGEGILIYPGEQAGLIGVAPSMRLKFIRDGIDDYDYIEMLKQAGYGEWALNIVREIAVDFEDWNPSPDALEAARIVLGNKLSEIQQSQLASNADLSELTVDGVPVSGFNADTLSYKMNVPYSKTSVTVAGTAADSNATIVIEGGDNLAVGDNTVTVTVTAQNNDVKIYKITVRRASGDTNPNPNPNPNPTPTPDPTPEQIKPEDKPSEPSGGNLIEATVTGNIAIAEVNADQVSGTDITVRSDISSFTLPAGAIDPVAIQQKLGSKDWKLVVRIELLSEAQQRQAAEQIRSAGGSMIGQAIDFTITAEANSRSLVLTQFNGVYMKHTIVTDSTVNSARATVVRIEGDGSFTFVPAQFIGREISFFTPTNSKYAVVSADRSFRDISGHWAKDDISLLASKFIVSGIGNNRFASERLITRAEFVKLVINAIGYPSASEPTLFKDVTADAWYAGYIQQAVKLGIAAGKGDGTFCPNDTITREEMAVMINNAMKAIGKPLTKATANTTNSTFTDSNKISGWAADDVAAAAYAGLLSGMPNGQFQPQASLTRAQASAVIVKLLQRADFIN